MCHECLFCRVWVYLACNINSCHVDFIFYLLLFRALYAIYILLPVVWGGRRGAWVKVGSRAAALRLAPSRSRCATCWWFGVELGLGSAGLPARRNRART